MKTLELGWRSKDGLDFFGRAWHPDQAAKGVICLVHGLGEHVGRYEHAGAEFAEAGYALLGFDQRGHGRSDGPRGHTPSYDALMDDIGELLDQAEKHYPGVPCFLYGHSMGGNEVINYGMRRNPPLLGVIATGPWLRLSFRPSAWQVALGRLMNKVAPAFTQASKLDATAISRDSRVVEAYTNDPLVHDRISARLFVEMYDSGEWALANAARLSIPLLLMHGGADRITSASASREFAQKSGGNTALHIQDGLYHEIHNEPEKSGVFKIMIAWLEETSGGKPGVKTSASPET
ncbi:MAG: alpha/beta hydrolase [Desulfobacteraceae bacterium]|nr:MAG: alpha/beta hydrolase [Desulfobacteraceae bacterium]